jgi:hypothetical protein
VRKAGGEMPAIPETQAHVHLVLELYWALLQARMPSVLRIHGSPDEAQRNPGTPANHE